MQPNAPEAATVYKIFLSPGIGAVFQNFETNMYVLLRTYVYNRICNKHLWCSGFAVKCFIQKQMTQHSAPFSPCIDSLELFSRREKSVNVMTKFLVCPLALSFIGRVLYCCREMMHVLLKMDFGFKRLCAEILPLRKKKERRICAPS